MKLATMLMAVTLLVFSNVSQAQETRYANIVSVTPVIANVQVIKQQCGGSAGYQRNESSLVGTAVGIVGGAVVGRMVTKSTTGTVVGAGLGGVIGNMVDNSGSQVTPNCRNVSTYEPTQGGYQVVYELDGQQYAVHSKTFPRGKTIAVAMSPIPIQE